MQGFQDKGEKLRFHAGRDGKPLEGVLGREGHLTSRTCEEWTRAGDE